MATSVTTKSRQNSFIWALDMNYRPTLPMMPSRKWTTSLVSWRKSKLCKSIKKYFEPNWDAKSLPLATSNGPFGAMTLVQSDNYLVAAHVIKDLFQLSPQAVAPTLTSYVPGNVMLHLPAKADEESEAKKGIINLMLLHIRGNFDIKATLVSNIIPAIPSKGMQMVLNQPCTAPASQFADLIRMTLELAKHQDFTSI
jgi:hypothetical protein